MLALGCNVLVTLLELAPMLAPPCRQGGRTFPRCPGMLTGSSRDVPPLLALSCYLLMSRPMLALSRPKVAPAFPHVAPSLTVC